MKEGTSSMLRLCVNKGILLANAVRMVNSFHSADAFVVSCLPSSPDCAFTTALYISNNVLSPKEDAGDY